MLATVLHGLVDNSYFLPDLSIFFWVLCALVEGIAAGEDNVPAPRRVQAT
jgi:hypothetical protein